MLTRATAAAMGSHSTILGSCETWTSDSRTTSTMTSSSEGLLDYAVEPEGRYVETMNGKLLRVVGFGQLEIVAEQPGQSVTMLVQTASVNVNCRKAEWFECFISCIIGCHTPARVVKEDEESRNEPHGTPKHNSELCSRTAHYSTARNRHFWRDTTETLPDSSQDGD